MTPYRADQEWHKDQAMYSVDSPYTPPAFEPGPEDCILPTLIEQKSRVMAGGILWRSRTPGKIFSLAAEWLAWDSSSSSYVPVSSRDDITIDGGTTRPPVPPNPPKIVITAQDIQSGATHWWEAPQYILTWTETSGLPPVTETIVEYYSATPALRSVLNFDEIVSLPTRDDVTGYTSANDPDIIDNFSAVTSSFADPRIDGKFVLAGEPTDPSAIRTGPDYTIAYLDSSEKSNNTGTMVPGRGLSAYNYVAGRWDPYPVS